MPTDPTPKRIQRKRTKDRALLRAAGEHLGTLAEREHERWLLCGPWQDRRAKEYWDRYAKLHLLSRQVLEIANV